MALRGGVGCPRGPKTCPRGGIPAPRGKCCVIHLMRNTASCTPSSPSATRKLARELYHLACEEMAGSCLEAVDLIEDTEADALAYLDFSMHAIGACAPIACRSASAGRRGAENESCEANRRKSTTDATDEGIIGR